MGAAYSSVIALTFYNLMRFSFLWFKFKFQPYTLKDLLIFAIAIVATGITYMVPHQPNILIDTIMRCLLFSVLFFPLLYYAKISVEVNKMFEKYLYMFIRLVKGSR